MPVCSYDVFDTCLVRTFATPPALFYWLAEKVLGPAASRRGGEVDALAQLRIDAERAAREAAAGREITLDAIYEILPRLCELNLDWTRMRALELEWEEQSLRPVPEIRREIQARRARGDRILFLSDMYLPSTFIRDQLRKHGFLQEGDALYVSSEHGVTKTSGRLFERASQREGLDVKAWEHVGDHEVGDVRVPRRLGIRARHFTATQLTADERDALGRHPPASAHAARIAGAARLCRLSLESEGLPPVQARLIGNVIVPFLTAFAAWALAQARSSGIRRLYFVARDGELPLSAARHLLPDGDPIELRYLYGSRRAWLFASVREVSRSSLEWVAAVNLPRGVPHLLERLHLPPQELTSVLQAHGLPDSASERDLTDEELSRFWDAIEEPHIAAMVLRLAQAERDKTIAYAGQEGLLDGTPAALVDLGWRGRCQEALNGALLDRRSAPLSGFYLALCAPRANALHAGAMRGWFDEAELSGTAAREAQRVFRNRALIEQCVAMPSHPSTRGYECVEGRWQPVFSAFRPRPESLKFHDAILRGMEGHARELRQYLAEGGDLAIALERARSAALRFIARPLKEEARMLRWIHVTNDTNENRFFPLVAPIPALRLARLIWHRQRGLPLPPDLRIEWREGSAAVSPAWLRPLLRALITARP